MFWFFVDEDDGWIDSTEVGVGGESVDDTSRLWGMTVKIGG